MSAFRRLTQTALILTLFSVVALIFQDRFVLSAFAQASPGAQIVTHHETIPNPVFGSNFRVAASCRSASQPCPWDDPNTWDAARVPDANTLVIVDGHVQVRSQSAIARSIGIYPGGKLTFSTTVNTQLATADLVIFAGGTLHIGTRTNPIDRAHRAEVIFRNLPFDGVDTKQHLRGLLAVNGVVRIAGAALSEVYLRSANEPGRGDSTITVNQSVRAAGWRVGDMVVIPTSKQCASPSEGCTSETEDRRITAISSDGLTVTLNTPLNFSHPGARNAAGSIDFMPHVIHKSRNVIFRSENPSGVRGHLLFHGRSDVDMRYAQVRDMGRTSIQNLGGANQKGRYPVHAHHLIGPLTPQTNGYQFTLLGNVVDFGTNNVDQNRKWGLTIHGSHFGLIERNVVDHASGAGLVTEDGSEMGNMFRENFVVRVVGGTGIRTEDRDPVERSKLGRAGVGYWFNGGGRNFFEANVVADVAECVYCYGFKFDNVYNGDLLFPFAQGSDPHMDSGETLSADAVGLNNFRNNEAYAVPNGLTVWWECTFGDYPNDNCASRLDRFTVWHHHRWGYHGYPTNNLTMANFVMRGNPAVLNNPYQRVTGFEFDDYMHRNLKIINADIQNVYKGINMSSMRDVRGATGPEVGFSYVEDSYIVATQGIGVWAQASVNRPTDTLPAQTTVIRNVRFAYPDADLSRQDKAHIVMHEKSTILDDNKTNRNKRNDVWVYNYNRAPGEQGDNLYIIPGYQGPSRCDSRLGRCNTELTSSYGQIIKGHIYPLNDSGSPPSPDPTPEPPTPDPSPDPTPEPPTPDPSPDPAPDPTPPPSSGNLVSNGTFDSRTAPWSGWSNDSSLQIGLDNGELKVSHDPTTSTVAQLFQRIGTVTAGNHYRLRFTVRANQNNAPLRVYLRRLGAPYTPLSQIKEIRVNTQSQNVDLLLPAHTTQGDSVIMMRLDNRTESIWIDNVSLVDITNTPLIKNGTFDDDTSAWGGWSSDNSLRLELDNGELKMSHDTTAGAIAQLYQRSGQTLNDHTYRVRLKVRSAQSNAPVSLFLQQVGAPYKRLSDPVTINASSQSRLVEILLTANQSHAESILVVQLDDRTDSIWLDDVSLDDISYAGIVTNGTFDSATVPWYSWSNDNSVQIELDNGEVKMSHDTTAGAVAQLFQQSGPMTAGNTYRLRFDVRSTQNNAPVSVFLQQSKPPYRRLSSVVTVPVSSQSQFADVNLTATDSDAESVVIFRLDDAAETIWLDNISLIDLTRAPY